MQILHFSFPTVDDSKFSLDLLMNAFLKIRGAEFLLGRGGGRGINSHTTSYIFSQLTKYCSTCFYIYSKGKRTIVSAHAMEVQMGTEIWSHWFLTLETYGDERSASSTGYLIPSKH